MNIYKEICSFLCWIAGASILFSVGMFAEDIGVLFCLFLFFAAHFLLKLYYQRYY